MTLFWIIVVLSVLAIPALIEIWQGRNIHTELLQAKRCQSQTPTEKMLGQIYYTLCLLTLLVAFIGRQSF